MKELVEKIENQISTDKEVITVLPRNGIKAIKTLLETIKEMKPKKVIYVSCNPATLGRDLKYLTDNGFEIKEVQPVDMFPQTCHVESVVLLEKI